MVSYTFSITLICRGLYLASSKLVYIDANVTSGLLGDLFTNYYAQLFSCRYHGQGVAKTAVCPQTMFANTSRLS